MPRVPRSVLRRSVFAVDGREEEEQRRKRHRESGDRLRRTAGLHLPIQSKGAKCDSRRPKISDLRCKHPTRHTQTTHFQAQRSAFSKITKNIKSHFILSSFCSAVRCRAPQSVAYRGWCTHRQADRPLPHLAAAAPALPVATRKTTRLSRQSPLLFVQNAPLFLPSPHASDTTRALASALQSRCISCLHPSPSHLPN